MDIGKDVLNNFMISAIFSLAGFLFDYWASINGYARSLKWLVIPATIFLVFGKPYLFKSVPWWIYSFMILIGITLLIHQFDIRESMRHGAWWWKRTKTKKRKKKPSA